MIEEKGKEKNKETKLKRETEKWLYSQAIWRLHNGTFESKYPTIKLQKKNKIANHVSP